MSPRWRTPLLVGGLLLALLVQLAVYVSRQSQTWDEGDHLYAGYRSLTHADFGLNPEHPPLAKMLAAAPLLAMDLRVPPLRDRDFKREAFLGGRDFVFGNDADAVLFRARLSAGLLTLLLALVAFLAAREMFGAAAGLTALALLAFDPNLLAHGALVTTDAGVSCFLLASVYAFYRFVKRPSWPRMVLVGLAAGLALATKHTGVLVLPILALLALAEWLRGRGEPGEVPFATRGLRLLGAVVLAGILAVCVLWSSYGFRYAARPDGLALNPPAAQILTQVPKPYQATLLSTLARWRVLPESYLCGLADVLVMEAYYRSYLFGKPYPHGVWFYFPAAYVVKSTLAFLILPVVIGAAILWRRLAARREVLFLAVPPLFYLLVAMSSRMNIGVRHILPMYAFIAVLGAGALWALASRDRRWAYAAAAILALHVGSSVRAFPSYMAYSNELWGGPSRTYRHLSDSNSDWAQQLKSLKKYLDARGVRDCWFAYFGQGTADLGYYGIPCRALPTLDGFWLKEVPQVPAEIEGTVVISAGVLSGFEAGPGALHLYGAFEKIPPTALIDGGLLVYDGRFPIPLASSLARAEKAQAELAAGRLEVALADARQAVALAPSAVKPNVVLGDALAALGRADEARPVYEAALTYARTIEPGFQTFWIGVLEARLGRR
jgi:tetratricopeptide (TPR) repeat protein